MKRPWLAVLAAPLVVAASLSWPRHPTFAGRDAELPAGGERAGADARPQVSSVDSRSEGAARTLAIHMRHVSVLEGGSSAPTTISVQLEGDMALVTVRRVEGRSVQRASLERGGKLAIQTGDQPAGGRAEIAELLGALEEPFFIELDEEGRVERFHFEPAVPTIARGLLRTVITSLQVGRGAGEAWQSRERDATGTYLASYRSEAAARLVKEKLRYERMSTAGKARALQLDVLESRSHIELDAWGAAAALTLREHLSVPAAGGAPGVSSRLALSAALVGAGMDADAVGSFEDRSGLLDVVEVDAIDGAEAARQRSDEALVGARSFEDLRAELEDGRDDSARLASAQMRLAALFRTDPGAALEAEAAVRGSKAGPDTRAAVAALAGAGTAEAQQALARVVEDPETDPALRQQAVMNAGLVEEPDDHLAAALLAESRATAGPLQRAATLALGSVASHAGGARASEWIDELVRRYRSAATVQERILLLDALGNSGHPAVLGVIGSALESTEEALRAAAARALRRIPDAKADQWLDALIAHDASEAVRAAALQACMSREPTAHLVSGRKALDDADATVRLGAVLLLGRGLAAGADVRGLLLAASNDDPSAEVRAAARSIVGG